MRMCILLFYNYGVGCVYTVVLCIDIEMVLYWDVWCLGALKCNVYDIGDT